MESLVPRSRKLVSQVLCIQRDKEHRARALLPRYAEKGRGGLGEPPPQ
ncbi:hypothetical protein CCP3SC1AL1_110010 [Gammaproteobacteria bacterium]